MGEFTKFYEEKIVIMLFIVPTPIGNLEDITLRALNILKSVDFILCEDTRTTRNLLKHYEIEKECYAYHIHNEHQQVANYVAMIKGAQNVALTSDAGTPAISDPGYLLVRECIANNVEVQCLPGATALIPAVVNSGLPCDKFYFHGFIPHKKGKESTLRAIAQREETSIFYESPYRVVKTLEMMLQIFGEERQICVSREISKLYEENFRGTIPEVLEHFNKNGVKGEFVFVVAGIDSKSNSES